MAIYKDTTFAERRDSANAAKKALLEKFKARPAADDPEVIARQAERKAILEARAIRETEKAKQKAERLAREAEERRIREEQELEARIKAEEEARVAEELRKKEEEERLAAQIGLEAAAKAKRDARYAARKQRTGRAPPTR